MPTTNGQIDSGLSVKKAIGLFVVLYLIFAVVRFPADRVWPEVLQRAGINANRIRLVGGEGSWLAASFSNVIVSGNDAGRLSFRLKPWYLLAGAVRVGLRLEKGQDWLAGDVAMSPWSMGVYDLNGAVSFGLINKLADLPGIELSGLVTLSDIDISLKNGFPDAAEGKIYWQKAGMMQPYTLTVGSFEAVISTDPEGIKINASDTDGDVMLKVAGTITPDGNYGINGELGTRESANPDLVSFLKILGEPGPDGSVRLSSRGNLKKIVN